MSNETVLQNLESGLLTITMNRPERRNALNPDMTLGLVAAARRAAEDHEVRAVLLKGAGGTFCVGGDVKSMAEGRAPMSFENKMVNLRRGMEVSRVLHEMSKPVVAQLDGAAAGAGLSIALSCDFRVASQSVKITTAFAKVGLSGDYGGTYFLTQMLGSAKARELYLMSPVLTAQEALALGMVTRRRSRSAISSATSIMPSGCRWKAASMPKPCTIRAPARRPITRKRRKPLSKSASRCFRTTE
jgi:2-(1,2-epoxy-1,2-dihydrophenyl)acetyl-CoA isomerase